MRPNAARMLSRSTGATTLAIALAIAALVTAMGVAYSAPSAGASPSDAAFPSPRQAMGMTWDGTNIVLFGGTEAGEIIKGDSWVWNGSAWTELSPDNPPCPRHSHRMVYDSVRNEVVMFGGTGSGDCIEGPGLRNDTWIWNGAVKTWTRVTPTGDIPSRRSSMGLAYDSTRRRVVLFGGDGLPADCPTPANDGRCGDTWTWNGTNQTWTLCDPETQCATHPSPRSSGEMAFHAGRPPGSGSVILYGGKVAPDDLDDETWAWNGTQWALLPGLRRPPPRNGQPMVYFPERNYILMFGGNVSSLTFVPVHDTWTLDGGTGSSSSHPIPPPTGAASAWPISPGLPAR